MTATITATNALSDAATFRRVLGHYPTGVCIVTASDENGVPAAMVVGSFTSASLDPPLIAFFPGCNSSSWPRIRVAGRLCVNILADDQIELCRRFSRKDTDKFSGCDYQLSPNGSPIFAGVVAWMDCNLEEVHTAGDHYIAICRTEAFELGTGQRPLIFHSGKYHSLQPLAE